MTSQNKNGGYGVGTVYVGCMEEQVLSVISCKGTQHLWLYISYIRTNVTIHCLLIQKAALDPLLVWKIYLTHYAMPLMSHQCFSLILFHLSW